MLSEEGLVFLVSCMNSCSCGDGVTVVVVVVVVVVVAEDVVGFAGACSVVVGDSEGLNVMFVIAIASSLAVAVTEPTAGGCADVDVVVFCFSPAPSIEPIYIMIATRSFSSIFPSKALMPWSNPSLYCAGFFSSSVFERFAASFCCCV